VVDEAPDFESADNYGATEVHGGANGITYDTITTGGVDVPKTNTKKIAGFYVRVGAIGGSQNVQISMDGGTSHITLGKNEEFAANIKGEPTALKVQTNSGTILNTLVEFVINLELN